MLNKHFLIPPSALSPVQPHGQTPAPRPSCLRHTSGGCERRKGPARCLQGTRSRSWLGGSKRSPSEASCSTCGRKTAAAAPDCCPHVPQPSSPGLPCLPPARALSRSAPQPQKPWSTSPAAPCLPSRSHWSRLGGLRSWSAITLAEKLYRFSMFWKKESSETSYYGDRGREEAGDNMLEKVRVPEGPFQASLSLPH